MNKAILIGHLGADPKVRQTQDGQTVANFSVATDESYKTKDGKRQERVQWHQVVAWGKQAEIAEKYLRKGALISVEGRFQSREWEGKQGEKHMAFEIVCQSFRMLGGRADGNGSGSATANGKSAETKPRQAGVSNTSPAKDGHGGSPVSADDVARRFAPGEPVENAEAPYTAVDNDIPF